MFEVGGLIALKLHDQRKLVRATRNGVRQARKRVIIRIANREDSLFEANQTSDHVTRHKLAFEVVVVRAEPSSKHHRVDVHVGANVQLVEIALLHEQDGRGDGDFLRIVGRTHRNLETTSDGVLAREAQGVATAGRCDERLEGLGQVVCGDTNPSHAVVIDRAEVHIRIESIVAGENFIGCPDEAFARVDLIGETQLGEVDARLLQTATKTQAQILLVSTTAKLHGEGVIQVHGELGEVALASYVTRDSSADALLGLALAEEERLVIRDGLLPERARDADPLGAVIHAHPWSQGSASKRRVQHGLIGVELCVLGVLGVY